MNQEIDLARFAAYLDGEGSIIIAVGYPRGCVSSGSMTLRIAIANTDFRLLYWLKEYFGGSITNLPRYNPKHSPAASWKISGRRAARLLEDCFQFLIIKKEQAELGIAFGKTINEIGYKLTYETRQKRARLEIN